MKKLLAITALLSGLIPAGETALAYDLSKDKVQYVAHVSHLDTQWQWTYATTLNEYLPKTTRELFYYFEKYPDFKFSYESAYHYMALKEHYPDDYARVKEYVKKGNWNLAGGMVVACDVNVPSPESLVRQFLYGNGFFMEEFGRKAIDVMMPDCFGFGFVLPTVASHCGMIGFSTQKIYCPWLEQPSGAYPKPFDIGVWEGIGGGSLIAAINPGGYSSPWDIREEQIDTLGMTTGIYAAFDYMGVGDEGGGCWRNFDADSTYQCTEEDVIALYDRIALNGQSEIKVAFTPSDQLFRDLTPEQVSRLRKYKGELLARAHGVGTYTAKAAMKRLNRKNELLAYSGECAAVMASQAAGAEYPGEEFKKTWIRFLWHQMHDDLTGTSIDEVYTDFSFPDEKACLASLTKIRDESLRELARTMDTRAGGTALLVFNPLNIEREDLVIADIPFSGLVPEHVRVLDSEGGEVISQVIGSNTNGLEVAFLAKTPACGATVYELKKSDKPCALPGNISVTDSKLSNGLIEVTVDDNGDISSIRDLSTGRQALASPITLETFFDDPHHTWHQWEIKYEQIQTALKKVAGPVKKSIVQQGPALAVLRVERVLDGSRFVQDIRLAAGSNRVEIENTIDWQCRETLLKAAFNVNAANPAATYDLQLGTIERGNNTEVLYEVPGHQWADITDISGNYGVAVLNDCKYGWDKPADSQIRLTLIHTPRKTDLDLGEHRFTYAVYPHQGDWREGGVVWEAARLNQPLVALPVAGSQGGAGKSYSFLRLSNPAIAVMALKKAEKSDCLVLRVRELNGQTQTGVRCTLNGHILEAAELNGMEEKQGEARTEGNNLLFDIGPYQIKTFAVKL